MVPASPALSCLGARGENILPARAGRWCGPRPWRRLAALTAGRHPPPGRPSSLCGRTAHDHCYICGTRRSPGARNATLEDLAALLRDQQARKVDVVAPATAIRADGARLVIDGTDPVLGPDGVTMTAGTYLPTEVCDQGIADKLGIPAAYLRKMREQKPGLYDANVNGWLAGDDRAVPDPLPARRRTAAGAARAFLSDGYKIIDNLDVLLAALDGVRQAGMPGRGRRVRPDRAADVRPGGLRAGPGRWPRRCWPGTAARSPARPGRTTRWCSPGS